MPSTTFRSPLRLGVWRFTEQRISRCGVDQMTSSSSAIPVTLIPGDGIGPEIVEATLAVLAAIGAPFTWDRQIAGLEAVAGWRSAAASDIEEHPRTRLALKGPLETPSGGGYRSSNVRLREEFKLYANVRPARTLIPGGRFEGVDLIVVRENLEGLYIGHEHYVQIDDDPHAVAMATGINTRAGSRRLLEFAFALAIATGRKKVTIVHKANIMKALTGIFLETGQQLYETSTRAHRAGHGDRRCLRDETRAQSRAVRRAGDHQPVRRHPLGPGRRAGRRPRAWRRAPTSVPMRRSSRPCTARPRTSPARDRQSHRTAAGRRADAGARATTAMAARLRSAIDATLNTDRVRTGDLGGTAGPRSSRARYCRDCAPEISRSRMRAARCPPVNCRPE